MDNIDRIRIDRSVANLLSIIKEQDKQIKNYQLLIGQLYWILILGAIKNGKKIPQKKTPGPLSRRTSRDKSKRL